MNKIPKIERDESMDSTFFHKVEAAKDVLRNAYDVIDMMGAAGGRMVHIKNGLKELIKKPGGSHGSGSKGSSGDGKDSSDRGEEGSD